MMFRKAAIVALVAGLLLLLFPPVSVQAQNGLEITGSSASAEFPDRLNFNLSARSDARITDIRLHYSVEQASFTGVTSEIFVDFTPDTAIDVKWTWDLRKTGGLPPGAALEYWWTTTDAQGNKAATAPLKIHFDDSRHAWHELTEGKITMYWYESQPALVQEMMSAAQQALTRLLKDTGAELTKPVKIYFYPSSADLRGGMIFPQEWTGGVMYTRFDIIAIGLLASNPEWDKRAIAHELTHLVIHQVTFNPYNDLPVWLDEGLAVYNEGSLQAGYSNLLRGAIGKSGLISVRSLSSPFSAYGDTASQSYAQSYSLVEFLVKNYGQEKMLQLLSSFRDGASYDGALSTVYGFDMDGLNNLWRNYATEKYRESYVPSPVIFSTLLGRMIKPLTEFLQGMRPADLSLALRRSR